MLPSPFATETVFAIGPVAVTRPVVTTWILIAVLAAIAAFATRGPGWARMLAEILVTGIEAQIAEITRRRGRAFLPLLGTLFLFVAAANLSGLVPGGEAPTGKLETPAALAAIVFASVHFYGVRSKGILGYLKGFAKPKLIMLPLNLLEEVTRSFSLMVRLFGNVMSGEFLIALVVAFAGLFLPIPLMILELLVSLVQAYIFTVLATVFIGGAVGDGE